MNVVRGHGHSMHPTIRDGEPVLFERDAPVRAGAIGVFPDVVHRIVHLEGDGTVWEKGESPAAWPRARRREELQGIAVAVVRDGATVELGGTPRWTLAWGRAQVRLAPHDVAARWISRAIQLGARVTKVLR